MQTSLGWSGLQNSKRCSTTMSDIWGLYVGIKYRHDRYEQRQGDWLLSDYSLARACPK